MVHKSSRGFTLVELLIATTITLLLILAITQGFVVVSQTVSRNRAMVELAGQLRGCTNRLQMDLEGIPAPVVPFQPSSAGRGYVEYGDGPLHDLYFSEYVPDPALAESSYLGDVDDYVMFTAESTLSGFTGRWNLTPVVAGGSVITATQAEIAWWTRPNDELATGTAGVVDPGETVAVYRRVLLLRPDLNTVSRSFLNGGNPPVVFPNYCMFHLPFQDPRMSGSASYNVNNAGDMLNLFRFLADLNNECDVSYHVVRDVNGNNLQVYIVANSVSDLALRQNRFAHDPLITGNPPLVPPTYISPLPTPPAPYGYLSGIVPGAVYVPGISNDPLRRFSINWLRGFAKSNDRTGEDIVLNNVVAFDIRAFDPTAAVSANPGEDGVWGQVGDDDGNGTTDDTAEACWPGSDDIAVGPGEPTYGTAFFPVPSPGGGSINSLLIVGYGAYVDLNYFEKHGWFFGTAPNPLPVLPPPGVRVPGGVLSASAFSSRPRGQAALPMPYQGVGRTPVLRNSSDAVVSVPIPHFGEVAYDTWCLDYEYNQFDDDNDGVVDEAKNGIDDPYCRLHGFESNSALASQYGPDDREERETSPPYPVNLQGLQVRVRVVETDTRQVRQATVVVDYTP